MLGLCSRKDMPELEVSFARLELENPIMVSSADYTTTPRLIEKAADAGASAVVTKSTFLEEEYKRVIKPYAPGKFPDNRPKFLKLGDGFWFMAGLSRVPAEKWVHWIRELKKNVDITIIASQQATSIEGHVETAKTFEEAGADAIEIGLACPIPPLDEYPLAGLRSHREPSLVEEMLKCVKKEVSIPVGAKITPEPSDPSALLRAVQRAGIDYYHLHRGVQPVMPPVDLETGRPIVPSSGCICGPPQKYFNLFNVYFAANLLGCEKPHITASGGIVNWRDVVEYIMYGCSTVQINSAIMKQGFGVIAKMKDGLLEYMKRKGYDHITDLRGLAVKKVISSYDTLLEAYAPTKGMITAQVDMSKCTLCKLCTSVCPEEAIEIKEARLLIDKDKCEGCGLCAAVCARDAIRISNIERLYEMFSGFEKG